MAGVGEAAARVQVVQVPVPVPVSSPVPPSLHPHNDELGRNLKNLAFLMEGR